MTSFAGKHCIWYTNLQKSQHIKSPTVHHGVTSGIKNGIDYFITSDQFHDDREIAQESFTEQLYFMETLTVAFQSPTEAIGTTSISSIETSETSVPSARFV